MKLTVDDIIEMGLKACGIGDDVVWPVRKGNAVVLMAFRERRIRHSKVGDRVPVKDGGYVEKTDVTGWVQWEFHWGEIDPPPGRDLRLGDRPLTGRVLVWPPASPQGPSGAEIGQIPAAEL